MSASLPDRVGFPDLSRYRRVPQGVEPNPEKSFGPTITAVVDTDRPEPAGPGPSSGRPRRLGILGGTFDPPHIGHLVTADRVREALDLDEVVLMVAGDPWQKRDRVLTPAADRLAMVEAAVAGVPGLRAGRDEVDRTGPTYTVDTLEALRDAEPGTELFLVLGSDAAAGIGTWHRSERVGELATVVVVARPGATDEVTVACEWVEVPELAVSSTEVRSRLAAGRSVRFLVPDAVVALAAERGLYREGP